MEAQTLARACGKAHLRHLEPEDLVALTAEAAAMALVPLAGTSWIPRERYVSSPLHRPACRRQRRAATRTRSATARDRLCGGHAITVVTAGASGTGTTARS